MRKLSILVIREETGSFLKELMALGCTELSDEVDLPSDSDLHATVKREIIDLTRLNANKDSIAALGTRYALMFKGFVPLRAEPELIALLNSFVCSWELEDISKDEADMAPVEMRYPWFFGKYRLAGRKLFVPLKRQTENIAAEGTTENEAVK
ncbi:MAG: hypothetical protein FWB97_05935 [Oscillospiraceae bacterium]|nr:hypothetical protein [Oscillospiraceae bacterium]